jgi:ribosomal protein S18 acetylase RimI-like enzyme
MTLDWIFSPYCSSGWLSKEAEKCFGVSVRPFDISQIKDGSLTLLPPHISSAVKDIRKKGLYKQLNGSEPMFYLKSQLIGAFYKWPDFEKALTNAGLQKIAEPNIPEFFVHPRLNNDRESTVKVIAVTDKDIAGEGLPSPAPSKHCAFGDLGTEESLSFMTEMTRQYGTMMHIAFAGSDVAGFVTHIPKPIAWRIGCKYVDDLPEKNVLQIIELYVYPQFRRMGIASQMLSSTREFCRKFRFDRIEVAASSEYKEDETLTTACKSIYDKFGFVVTKVFEVPDSASGNPGFVRLQYLLK